jgi:hypothetical protein
MCERHSASDAPYLKKLIPIGEALYEQITMSMKEAFAKFSTKPRNPRLCWSARNEQLKTVVVTLWKDRILWKANPIAYDGSEPQGPDYSLQRQGGRDRLDDLRWARDNCGGELRVILVTPADPNAVPRKVIDYDAKDWVMRLTELNEKTGEFKAVLCRRERI